MTGQQQVIVVTKQPNHSQNEQTTAVSVQNNSCNDWNDQPGKSKMNTTPQVGPPQTQVLA